MINKVIVRRMTTADIAGVARLEKQCFSMPWSEKAFEESLSQAYAVFFVAELKGDELNQKNIIGYVGVYHIGDDCDITNVAVSQEYRRQGVGRKLLCAVDEYAQSVNAQSVTLEVREGNTPAIGLYEAMGYKNIGIRKNFYEKPLENAIIMVRR